MEISKDVLNLVRTVAELPREDQTRILRIVDLLTLAPSAVQRRTQRMLRALLEAKHDSKVDYLEGVDEVIDYLENAVLDEADSSRTWATLDHLLARTTTQ